MRQKRTDAARNYEAAKEQFKESTLTTIRDVLSEISRQKDTKGKVDFAGGVSGTFWYVGEGGPRMVTARVLSAELRQKGVVSVRAAGEGSEQYNFNVRPEQPLSFLDLLATLLMNERTKLRNDLDKDMPLKCQLTRGEARRVLELLGGEKADAALREKLSLALANTKYAPLGRRKRRTRAEMAAEKERKRAAGASAVYQKHGSDDAELLPLDEPIR